MFNNKNIFIALTYKCNAFCKKCMTRYHVNKDIEMNRETLERILYLLKLSNYNSLISVGTGEPLLYKDIHFFINEILNLNKEIRLRMLTNGMLLNSNQNANIFNKRCKWGITLDGFYQKSLDGLQKGVDIEKVKHNIVSITKKYGGSQIYLNLTVYQGNIEDILPFCKFAVDNGITDIYLTELKVFSGYQKDLDIHKPVHDEYLKNVLSNAKKILIENGISAEGINITKEFNRYECYKNKMASPIIDVDGGVTFCSGREDNFIGNIFDEDIEKKWRCYKEKIDSMKGKWCNLCFDKKLSNGEYRLPKTIRKEII